VRAAVLRAALFTPASVMIGGKYVRASKITCASCKAIAMVRVNNFAHTLHRGGGITAEEERHTARKFETLGWHVGATVGRHRCPGCIVVKQPAKPTTGPALVAVPPRTMTRDDKRIIYEKLSDTWESEKVGYVAPWTDKRVAEDLAVPLAWVVQIRQDMFGDVASNPEIDAAFAKATAIETNLRTLATRLLEEADSIAKKLTELRDAVRP
jgi:hypothetical protein